MKKLLLFFGVLTTFSLLATTIPNSITLTSGNILIRLDSKKFYNTNRIEWKNFLVGVDEIGAHYGVTYQPKGSKFFIGSGHDESGKTEKLVSLDILVDNKKITPKENVVIKGKKIQITKFSKIINLRLKYTTIIENDVIYERSELFSVKNVAINYLYLFMHPWSTRFDQFHAIFPNGKKLDIKLNSSNTFPNRNFVPSAAWYDSKSGIGVVTTITNIKGKKLPRRFLWDRSNYRKDYLCDYSKSILPTNKVVIYEAKTSFFQEQDSTKWISVAEKLFSTTP